MYQYPQIDWDALRKFRMDKVKDLMVEADADALVLTGHDNIRYATDFGVFLICESYDWFAAIVTREGEAYLFIPYVDEAMQDPMPNFPWIREYIPTPSWISSITQEEIWVKMLAGKLQELQARNVGLDTMSFQLYDGLKGALPETRFSDVFMPLSRARQVKHPEEIKLIRSSAEIASLGGAAGLKAMQEGAIDFEVLSAVDGTMRALGAEFITHNVCVRGGSQLAAGWFPKGDRLWAGATMAFDWGCYVKGGYSSDVARTGFVEMPPQEVRKAYRVLNGSPPGHRATGPPGHRATGPPGHRATGPPGHRATGPPGHRATGPPGHRATGPPGHRATGPPGHRATGPPGHRATGPPGHRAVAKPGVKVSVLDKTVNDYLRKSGYPTTPYSLGHGVGLRVCELPIIYRPEMMVTDDALEEGMVICLEPQTSVESRGDTVVVKVEDMYQVTKTGLDRLSTTGYTPFWEE